MHIFSDWILVSFQVIEEEGRGNSTLKGLGGSMHLRPYIHNLYEPSPCLNIVFIFICWVEIVLGISTYVKEKIKIYSYVTFRIKVRSMYCNRVHPCVLEPKTSITIKCPTDLKSALDEWIDFQHLISAIISSKWKYVSLIHDVFVSLAGLSLV